MVSTKTSPAAATATCFSVGLRRTWLTGAVTSGSGTTSSRRTPPAAAPAPAPATS